MKRQGLFEIIKPNKNMYIAKQKLFPTRTAGSQIFKNVEICKMSSHQSFVVCHKKKGSFLDKFRKESNFFFCSIICPRHNIMIISIWNTKKQSSTIELLIVVIILLILCTISSNFILHYLLASTTVSVYFSRCVILIQSVVLMV